MVTGQFQNETDEFVEENVVHSKIYEVMHPKTPERSLPFLVQCRIEDSGETFTAVCQKSRAYPKGKVLTITDYVYPKKPTHLPVSDEDPKCKQWRWDCNRAILERFVGNWRRQDVSVDSADFKSVRVDYQEKLKALEIAEAKPVKK